MQFDNYDLSAYSLDIQWFKQQNIPTLFESTKRFRDAIYLELDGGDAWLFDYGILVIWGANFQQRQALLEKLGINEANLADFKHEHLKFTFGTHSRVGEDTVTIAGEDPLSRLAVSHALAQSLKLNAYENQAQNAIQQYAHLPKELADTGTIKLSRKQTAKIRGRLFNTKSEIILHYGLFDIPEFFWEYPDYEMTYQLMANYLEIQQRVDLLKLKLDTIQQLFQMLADEQKHQHSAFLEWIIIILIPVEIVIFVGEELQQLFK